MTQDEAETAKLFSGTAAPGEIVVSALLASVSAALEGAEGSVWASAMAESGAEGISAASLVHKVIKVTGMDMHLSEKQNCMRGYNKCVTASKI